MRNVFISFKHVSGRCLRNFHRNYACKNDSKWDGFRTGEAMVRLVGLCQNF